jgi:hypothetical protein
MWLRNRADGHVGYYLHEGGTKSTDINVGLTPLYAATLFGHQEMVRFLLACGANPNCQSEYQQTPLHLTLSLNLCGPKIEDAWTNNRTLED